MYKKTNNENITHKINPVKIYGDLLINKSFIIKENKNISGIYLWLNFKNNKKYVGSSQNLGNRIRFYLCINNLKRKLEIDNSLIYRALLKHNYSNFKLEILELCDKKYLLEREQFYIDLFKPEYNTVKTAGSTLGFKHSVKTLLKFKNRSKKLGIKIIVTDMLNGIITKYSCIMDAAKSLNVSRYIIKNYSIKNILLKERYLITNYKPLEHVLDREKLKYRMYNLSNNHVKEFSNLTQIRYYMKICYNIIIAPRTITNYVKSGKTYKKEFKFYKTNI